MPKTLRTTLQEILNKYDFSDEPLLNLKPKLRLHSALAYKSSYAERGDLYKEEVVEKATHIFRHLDIKGDSLFVYDSPYNESHDTEMQILESSLVNIKSKEEYDYIWFDEVYKESYLAKRMIIQAEGFNAEELFSKIALTDFTDDYNLDSTIYIVDLNTNTIFHLYDDRGIYIMATDEKILQDLWEYLPDSFFEDCYDFEIKINDLYWIDGSTDNKVDLCLHGDLEIRLNDEIIEYSSTVSAAGLRLLRSLDSGHIEGNGDHLFPCCGNTFIANEELDKLEIVSCDKGLDWSVNYHHGFVTINTHDNLKTTYYYLQYKREVLKFVEQIEDFYKQARKRIIPDDEFNKDGYVAFWNEWNTLKEQAAWE